MSKCEDCGSWIPEVNGHFQDCLSQIKDPAEGKKMREKSPFATELEALINRYSIENGSNTPDFILAAYLCRCLSAFNEAVIRREDWLGRNGKESE